MQCCNKNDDQQRRHGKKQGHLKHIIMMIFCCALPMVLVFTIPLIGNLIPGSARILAAVAPFLCPVLMIGMIPMMIKNSRESRENEKDPAMKTEDHPN